MISIGIAKRAGEFAEDKDVAANLRDMEIRPALREQQRVRLDFSGVAGATQSFVHALIADVIRTEGPLVLNQITFHGCNPTVRSIVGIVAEYSQLDLPRA